MNNHYVPQWQQRTIAHAGGKKVWVTQPKGRLLRYRKGDKEFESDGASVSRSIISTCSKENLYLNSFEQGPFAMSDDKSCNIVQRFSRAAASPIHDYEDGSDKLILAMVLALQVVRTPAFKSALEVQCAGYSDNDLLATMLQGSVIVNRFLKMTDTEWASPRKTFSDLCSSLSEASEFKAFKTEKFLQGKVRDEMFFMLHSTTISAICQILALQFLARDWEFCSATSTATFDFSSTNFAAWNEPRAQGTPMPRDFFQPKPLTSYDNLLFPLTGKMALRLKRSPNLEEPLGLAESSRVYFTNLEDVSTFNKFIHICSDDCVLSRAPMILEGANCIGDFSLNPKLFRNNLVDGIAFGLNLKKSTNAYGAVERR